MKSVIIQNVLRILLVSLIALFIGLPLAKAQAPDTVQTNMTIMLNAVRDGVYGSFIAAGSTDFKETYTQESFLTVSELLAPRLRGGYDIAYLDSLIMKGYVVFLWKLSFANGGDDSLLSISIQNGFVVGFLVQ